MAVQNETVWLLELIRDEWPGGIPDNVALRNRDNAETWYPDPTWTDGQREVREQAADADRYVTLGVSSGSITREIYGNKPQYRVQRTLDVRIEAKNADEWGEMVDDSEFKTIYRYSQEVINGNMTYPSVDPGADSVGFVNYEDLWIQDEQPQFVNTKDHYLSTYSVRLDGKQDTPDQ